ncbi:hypothetical protein [Alteribacillus sp. HJP-4]|uniref:hypothetical protein n=1 Tax=Alteribacillus sp. HJP-4 TaxID=2775394 RepID=UPI0035CCF329
MNHIHEDCLRLIIEAKQLGYTPKEIRQFIQKKSWLNFNCECSHKQSETQQKKALEYLLSKDTNNKDNRTHTQALVAFTKVIYNL